MSAVAHIDEYKTGRFFEDEFRGGLSWNGYENNVLLQNQGMDANGEPRFLDVGMGLGADDISDARGLALADFDNDGDLDLLMNNNPGDRGVDSVPPVLLRNDIGAAKNWLAVSLEGRKANRDAVGAQVIIEVDGVKQVRLVEGGSGYASQYSRRLYFGVNKAERVDRMTVVWPGGERESFENLGVRELLHVVQGEGLKRVSLPVFHTAQAQPAAPASSTGGD